MKNKIVLLYKFDKNFVLRNEKESCLVHMFIFHLRFIK